MAQIRGSWFPSVRSSLERHGLLAATEAALPSITRAIFAAPDATAWYDEGHAVAIYEEVANGAGLPRTRDVGRDAARYAMVSTWRDMMQALVGFLGGSPRMAFEQLPVLWNATRRDAGELRCVESSVRHAVTDLVGFPYVSSAAWIEVWAGHHEALLRHLRFAGHCEIESIDVAKATVRMRTAWGTAVGSVPTGDFDGKP